jgi:hypothetical protein
VEGHLLSGNMAVPFVMHMEGHIRLLITIPLMVVATVH